MALVVFQHSGREDAARLGQVLQGYGHRLRVIRRDAGQTMPPDLDDVAGVISLGGPMNVDQADAYPWMAAEMDYLMAAHLAGLAVVGVCLGAQLLAAARGGGVRAMPEPEVGWHHVRLSFPGTIDPVLAGIPWNTCQFHLHGQEVAELPPGATPLASSQKCKAQAFRIGLKTYAFQYHFEWEKADIAAFSQDGLVARAGTSADQIAQDAVRHYDDYRHLGDRLCENIAQLLFPIDKRWG